MSELPFTGERFTPECLREIWYEHYHRYAFARALVKGRRVADVACGEGYGAALLAAAATTVVGVDIDPASVAHARQRYGGSAMATSPICASSAPTPPGCRSPMPAWMRSPRSKPSNTCARRSS